MWSTELGTMKMNMMMRIKMGYVEYKLEKIKINLNELAEIRGVESEKVEQVYEMIKELLEN